MDQMISRRNFFKSAVAFTLCVPVAAELCSCGNPEYEYNADYFKDTYWELYKMAITPGNWVDTTETVQVHFRDNGEMLWNGNDVGYKWKWGKGSTDDCLILDLRNVTYESSGRPSKNNKVIEFMFTCDDISGEKHPYAFYLRKI